jgi:hypothetical protein
MGVVVEPRADAHSTSRLAHWFLVGTRAGVAPSGEWSGGWCASRDWSIRRGRVLGGPAVGAAFGGNLKPALAATQGGTAANPSRVPSPAMVTRTGGLLTFPRSPTFGTTIARGAHRRALRSAPARALA